MGARSRAKRLTFERELWDSGVCLVAGVDEAGRGPLAGPVVAAAVCLPMDWSHTGVPAALRSLNDSKLLTSEKREYYFQRLISDASIRYGIASVGPDLIDQINILEATHRAMNEALAQLQPAPEHVLVDGYPVRSMQFRHTALVKGDSRSYSIAAASVLAKVTRDRMMVEWHQTYPQYEFCEHKGYGTPRHLAALAAHGPCPIHRRSFAPIRPGEMELDLFD
jgi:ribonuclease HII